MPIELGGTQDPWAGNLPQGLEGVGAGRASIGSRLSHPDRQERAQAWQELQMLRKPRQAFGISPRSTVYENTRPQQQLQRPQQQLQRPQQQVPQQRQQQQWRPQPQQRQPAPQASASPAPPQFQQMMSMLPSMFSQAQQQQQKNPNQLLALLSSLQNAGGNSVLSPAFGNRQSPVMNPELMSFRDARTSYLG